MTALFERFVEHTASYNLDIQCSMDGDERSKIAVVGEYIGEQEALFNKMFVGGGGKHLMNALRSVGINRNDCYCTTLIKRRVTSKTPVPQMEYELWKEALQFELAQLHHLEVIIVVGGGPLAALLGLDDITRRRGSVYDYNGCKVVVANNPSIIMRDPSQEIVFLMDMKKAADILKGDYKPHFVKKILYPTFDEAIAYIATAQASGRFSTDIECIGMETACIGVAYGPNEAMCIAFRDQRDNYYTVAEEAAIMLRFIAACDDPTTVVIAQNGSFDSYFMGYKDYARFQVNFDTLLAHHTLYPKLPHNLGFLTAQYTTHPYYKDEKDAFHEGGDLDGFWSYNATDAAITYAIATELEKELREQNLHSFFTTHVMRLHPHLVEATVNGILVDVEEKTRLHKQLTKEVEDSFVEFAHVVTDATGDHELVVNPNSPKQLKHLFYDLLKCTHASGSTAAPIRDIWLKDPRVSERAKNLIIKLNRYAEVHKFFSTYVNTTLDPDDRYRCEWKQFGTQAAPGRLSSSQVMWKSGGNMQNQPENARGMFIADPGLVWFSFDLGQAEARYVAWDANIEQWKHDFELARTTGDYDAHRSLAATMFKKPYDQIPKADILDAAGRKPNHPEFDPATSYFTERYIAKRCRHGLNYRMEYPRLAQTTGLSIGEAAKNYYTYHRTNPELKHWWAKIEADVRRKRMLFNSLGRRLIFLERLDSDDALKSIVAFRPQSTIGDKVSQVWYEAHEDDRWDHTQAKITINIHDALYGVATPQFAKTAMSIIKAYAEKPIMVTSIVTNKTEPMIIPADFKWSAPEGRRSMSNQVEIKIEAAKI